ncbi:hypothetical protein J0895_24255 [Phormidium pseudopriestleyi FRX01]|uniref:Chromosome segregation ATPase n=1 Tax=Phormidium pseudopriestleyi FRX01 TaxID=1759528 RepID=A0ABS3G0K1_9CYAN|nr:hypothetical protein [Phormidium pseudopriestleyi]MBO0352137.1 hypothetical protein [Phormidium pseudopriestleyi FRX01]
MSVRPKYSPARLDRQRRQRLERERRQRAEEEARRRQQAEIREKQRRLEARRQQVQQQAANLTRELSQQQPHLYPEAAPTLHQQLQQQQQTLAKATSEAAVGQVSRQLDQLQTDLQRHLAQKRRDEFAKKRQAECDRQQFALAELHRQLAEIPDGTKFAPHLQADVSQKLKNVKQIIQSGDPTRVRQPLQAAEQALDQYRQQVAERRADWQRRQGEAQENLIALQSLIAGLQADPVVMRWQSGAIAQLEQQCQTAEQAISSEQFEEITPLLAASQQQSQILIDAANTAQLQADQRDYIADSIAQSLESLGFGIIYRQPEHPENPASAVILGAASHGGKGISVSIPTEGEVFYDVEGYSKQTAAAVGGGSAAVCDEASTVISEMHHCLEAEFGIQMGELQWEGKDPNRRIHQADNLPRTDALRVHRRA